MPSPVRSAGGPQRLDIEFERHDGLDQSVGLQNPRVDLPEATDLPIVQHDGGPASGNEIRVVDWIDIRGPTHVPHQAEDQGFRLRERGFVMVAAAPMRRTFLALSTTSAISKIRCGSSRCLFKRKMFMSAGSIDERRVVRSSFSGFLIRTRSGVSKASFEDAIVSDITSWYP